LLTVYGFLCDDWRGVLSKFGFTSFWLAYGFYFV
jgi:hypothetical protein